MILVSNHADLFVKRHRVAVQQLECLARLAPANVKSAMDFVEVKDVAWAAQFKHDVVGNIHQRRHAALAATRQAVHHPGRRGGLRIHVANNAAGKTATQLGRADLDGQLVGVANRNRWKRRRIQGCIGQGGNFPRDAINAQAVRQIGRELEREQHVIELEVLADVLPQRRIGSQFEQTTLVFRQLEFPRRAQHAPAFDAAQLAHLDEEGCAIFAGWQFGAHQRARHLDADSGIGCSTNNGEQTALPHINLAHAQAVGIRMLHGFHDFADHDMGKRRSDRLEFFNLKSGHGQGFSELLGAERRVAKFAQPGF